MTFGTLGSGFMARNDFRLAAERGEAAAYSADGWLAMGQRGRAAAIYLELRQIDARAVQQLAREIETARRHVREGEERIARQQALMEKTRVLVIWETPPRARSC